MTALLAGIEAGGTKFNCVIGSGPSDIRAEIRIDTTTPAETLDAVIRFLKDHSRGEKIQAIGIGSFGPVDLHPGSKTYGFITTTPKPGWAFTDVVNTIGTALQAPVAFDTDVNAAALGEGIWGAAQDLDTFLYTTIGTGIGAGGSVNQHLLHGLVHPEMGHIRIPHDRQADPFPGGCPFHGDCFEGLASGPAMQKRWGQAAETFPPDHPAWDLEANYIALAMSNFICTFSPQRLILGGGVMQQKSLFSLIRAKVIEHLNGYIQAPDILDRIDEYIVPPGLGNKAGVLGSLALARSIIGG